MAKNIYQGDPKLFLSEEGAYLDFRDGQPIMDAGLENPMMITLFTRRRSKENNKPWVGNLFFDNIEQHYGSDFLKSCDGPITIGKLEEIQKAAEKALQRWIDSGLVSEIIVEVRNPSGYRIDISILIRSPKIPEVELLLIKNGLNWIIQRDDPAYKRFE